MKRLRAAVIGLGIGEQHILGYQQHPQCEVVALCDQSNEKRSEVALRYPTITMTSRAEDVLDNPEIDVVSIATYDDSHYEYVIRALERGKHVFVEKPLCLYAQQARHIREILREHPQLQLSSNLILRKSPRFQQLKKMANEGVFGDFFFVEGDYNYGRIHKIIQGWRGMSDFYSVVYGGGVHIVDLLMWLTGERIVEVSAYANQIASKGSTFRYPDMVVSLLKFENGLIGKMAVNFGCVYPHFHPLTLYGTSATFVNRLEEGLLYRSRELAAIPEKMTTAYPCVQKGALLPPFIDSIVGAAPPEVSADDVFRAMSVCFAIQKSQETGSSVVVDYI